MKLAVGVVLILDQDATPFSECIIATSCETGRVLFSDPPWVWTAVVS